MKYSSYTAANRNLTILRLLEQEPNYAMNDSVLQSALASFGHAVSRDQVREDFKWLRDHDLVTVDIVSGRVWVAQITTRGTECAKGLVVVDGVQRPSPHG